MEPHPKRRRLGTNITNRDPGLSSEVLPPERRAHMSSIFKGLGVSNSNGTWNVGRDVVIGNPSKETNSINARSMLFQSLDFDQMDARHLSIKKAHANTCGWVMQTESYNQWKEQGLPQSKRFLWVKGKPGAGKSTLMKFLLGEIRKMSSHNRLISFFFNARGNHLERSTVGMYRSLLFQLLEQSRDLWHVLDNLRPSHQWTVESLKSLFEEIIQELKDTSVVCIIDALDECDDDEIRDMVQFLSGLIETGSQLSVCFASRHYPYITVKNGLSIILEERDEHQHDIATYLSSALQIGQGTSAEQISFELQKKACGVFMWVVLVVDILNREYDAGRNHSLHERLRQLPGDLHALFSDILTRDSKHPEDLLLCIQWVLFAKAPLTPKELYFAILSGSEPGHLPGCHSDPYSEDVVQKYILSTSKGLAESTKSESPTIQFIHESVRDFLLKEHGLSRVFPDIAENIYGRSHDAIKECCFTYMLMQELLQLQGSPRNEALERFPLLEYANNGVLYHADQAEDHGIPQDDFLAAFPLHTWVKEHNFLQRHKTRRYTSKVTPLYIFAEAGTPSLVRAHSRRSPQSCFEVENERYGCPILAATIAKNDTTVEVMLEVQGERLPNFSFADFRHSLPRNLSMSYATSRNFEFKKKRELLPQLLEHGNELVSLFWLVTGKCNIHEGDERGKTVVKNAVINGCGAVVKELLQRGVDPSFVDLNGDTLLHLAGSGEVAQSLLGHGVNVSVVNNDCETPLHQASSNGKFKVANLLISHGADVSAVDINGQTPLHQASSKGTFEVANLLISHGADVSAVDINGETPLHRASRKSLEIAKLLIGNGADMSVGDNDGNTPLHKVPRGAFLADEGSKLIKLLVDHEADVSAVNKDGNTPLHVAGRAIVICKVGCTLIELGSDPSAVNNRGVKAVDDSSSIIAESFIHWNMDVAAQPGYSNCKAHSSHTTSS